MGYSLPSQGDRRFQGSPAGLVHPAGKHSSHVSLVTASQPLASGRPRNPEQSLQPNKQERVQGVLDQILWAPLLFLSLFFLWIPGHILLLLNQVEWQHGGRKWFGLRGLCQALTENWASQSFSHVPFLTPWSLVQIGQILLAWGYLTLSPGPPFVPGCPGTP